DAGADAQHCGYGGALPAAAQRVPIVGKELAPHRIHTDRHLRITLRAVGGEIGRDRPRVVETDHRAARRFRDQVAVDQRGAGAWYHGHADADKAVADDVARYGDVAQIFAPAGDDAEGGRVLDDIPGHGGIRLDIDADAGVVVRRGADRPLRHEIADDV